MKRRFLRRNGEALVPVDLRPVVLRRKSAAPNPPKPNAPVATAPAPIPPKPNAKPRSAFSPKERAFINEYMILRNATQAVIAAGYNVKAPGQMAHALLKKSHIAEEIRRREAAMSEKYEITADRLDRELVTLALANMGNYMKAGADGAPILSFADLTREQMGALQEITTEEFKDGRSDKREVRRIKFKLAPKTHAIELLYKRLGLFAPEKHEHNHSILGILLQEIDARNRGGNVIDHIPASGIGTKPGL